MSPEPAANHYPLRTALLAMLLAGCTAYREAPLDLDRAPREFAARRLDAPELREFVTAFVGHELPDWSAAPLSLAELQAIALRHRPELATARAALAEATASLRVAEQLPNPHLAIGPGIVTNPGDAQRWLLSAGLLLPLDLAGRRSARERIAAADRTTAALAVAEADQAIRRDVAERAFTGEHAHALAALADEAAAVLTEAAALAERRAEAGAADAGEVAIARTAAQRAVLAQGAAAREAVAADDALAIALGLPATALADHSFALPFAGDADLPTPTAAQLDELAATAVRQRLDVARSLGDYARREAELALAVADQYPDLEIGPGYEYDQGSHKFRLDVGFTLPLFHGNDAAIAAATAARTSAATAVEAVQMQALAEIAAARRQLAAQPAALAATRDLAATAAAHFESVRQRGELGADDATALLAARSEQVTARTALADQVHAARLAWLRCEIALQQPIGEGLLAWQCSTPELAP